METLPSVIPKKPRTRLSIDHFSTYVERYPKLLELRDCLEARHPGQVRFQLPPLDSLAGTVVRHTTSLLDHLLERHDPAIFKIGFTHDPFWRWGNNMYGYVTSKEKWSTMTVMYLASEPHSPAMLEAALIDKYQSTLV